MVNVYHVWALQTYKYLGRLAGGAFYDSTGQATQLLKSVEEKAVEGKRLQEQREQQELQFPPCNSKWTQSEGE
jgi:hypothetical protein